MHALNTDCASRMRHVARAQGYRGNDARCAHERLSANDRQCTYRATAMPLCTTPTDRHLELPRAWWRQVARAVPCVRGRYNVLILLGRCSRRFAYLLSLVCLYVGRGHPTFTTAEKRHTLLNRRDDDVTSKETCSRGFRYSRKTYFYSLWLLGLQPLVTIDHLTATACRRT